MANRKVTFFLSNLLGVLTLLPTAVFSAPGTLDLSFGTNGVVTDTVTSDQGVLDLAIQTDGKIVTVGSNGNDFLIVRYTSSGSRDTSFDTDGQVTTDFNGQRDFAQAVGLQTDGKIVVGGFATLVPGTAGFALVRYNSDGTLDTTFDTDGRVTTFNSAIIDSLAIDAAGKIIVAGGPLVARYNSNGSADTTFSGDGVADFGNTIDRNSATGLSIQTDGKIVASGWTIPQGTANADFLLIRYNTDGTLDTTFDTDGKQTTDINTANNFAFAMKLDSSGKIVVAGIATVATNQDFALVRYNTNGTLDTGFDTDGIVTTNFGTSDQAVSDIAIQTDGKIIAVGYADNGTNLDFAAARYNTNGSLDTTFGVGGKAAKDIAGYEDWAQTVDVQTNGQIVASGYYADVNFNLFFVMVRVNGSSYESMSGTVAANGTLNTDVEGDGATSSDPVETAITVPAGGTVEVTETTGTTPTSTEISFLGQQVVITAPTATVANPLVIRFTIDGSITGGVNKNTLKIYKDGVEVPNCTGAPQAIPNPCVSARDSLAGGDIGITVLTTTASDWNLGVTRQDWPLVTAGGWINFEGKGTFAFTVHSIIDKLSIEGQIEFKSGDLKFKSGTIDSLETGDTRAKFSGTGSLNGQAGFNYLVIVQDDSQDQFRIKITDPDGLVVYDNVPASSDDLESATLQEISGGNVVIH